MVVEFIYWLLGAQVELVKASGQNYSSSHILDVYRGSLSQSVCLSSFIYLCVWCACLCMHVLVFVAVVCPYICVPVLVNVPVVYWLLILIIDKLRKCQLFYITG